MFNSSFSSQIRRFCFLIFRAGFSSFSERVTIKEADFSQGTIYRYYANLDEIYIDFINKHTTHNHLRKEIDSLLKSDETEKIIIEKCFIVMGKFIEELMNSLAGKIFFELLVLYSGDPEKQVVIFPELIFKQDLDYARNKFVKYITKNIKAGIFHPVMPVNSILHFVNSFIDGIALQAAVNKTNNDKHGSKSAPNISEMFQLLAMSIINFLGA